MTLVKFKNAVLLNSHGVSVRHGEIVEVEDKELLKKLLKHDLVEMFESIKHKKLTKQMRIE
jgi:hypothetical protein